MSTHNRWEKLNMFVCECCHSLFESEKTVDSCPSCRSKHLILSAGAGKRLIVPAVRLATDKEAGAYRQIVEAEHSANDLQQRIEKLNSYNLLDSEFNLALILLWLYRDYPLALIQYRLKEFLTPGSSFFTSDENRQRLTDFCELAKSRFSDDISKERKSTQCNNIVKVAEKIEGDSAAGMLLRFRQSEEDTLNRKIPNLANIRGVDINAIAKNPSIGLVQFLIDLYNGVV